MHETFDASCSGVKSPLFACSHSIACPSPLRALFPMPSLSVSFPYFFWLDTRMPFGKPVYVQCFVTFFRPRSNKHLLFPLFLCAQKPNTLVTILDRFGLALIHSGVTTTRLTVPTHYSHLTPISLLSENQLLTC